MIVGIFLSEIVNSVWGGYSTRQLHACSPFASAQLHHGHGLDPINTNKPVDLETNQRDERGSLRRLIGQVRGNQSKVKSVECHGKISETRFAKTLASPSVD